MASTTCVFREGRNLEDPGILEHALGRDLEGTVRLSSPSVQFSLVPLFWSSTLPLGTCTIRYLCPHPGIVQQAPHEENFWSTLASHLVSFVLPFRQTSNMRKHELETEFTRLLIKERSFLFVFGSPPRIAQLKPYLCPSPCIFTDAILLRP